MLKPKEFALKHNLTVDTLRFYTDQGLLIPKIKNKRFFYDDESEHSIKLIKNLKEMNFTLSEIKTILNYNRIKAIKSKQTKDSFMKFFNDKEKEVFEIIEKNKNAYNLIKNFKKDLLKEYDIDNSPEDLKDYKFKTGVPIEMLNILCCQKCGSNLLLNNTDIINNEIMTADLNCSKCNSKIKIREGIILLESSIIIDDEDAFEKLNTFHIEYNQKISGEFMSPILRAGKTLGSFLNDNIKSGEIILEMGTGLGTFMVNTLQQKNQNTNNIYYIANDIYLHLIKYSKKLFEEIDNNKAIFICGDCKELPIKKQSIDYIVDFVSMYSYLIFKESIDLYFDNLICLLKNKGIFLGAYINFEKGINKFEKDYKWIEKIMNIENIKNNLSTLIELKCFQEGLSKDKGDFDGIEDFKEINVYSIIGKKI